MADRILQIMTWAIWIEIAEIHGVKLRFAKDRVTVWKAQKKLGALFVALDEYTGNPWPVAFSGELQELRNDIIASLVGMNLISRIR